MIYTYLLLVLSIALSSGAQLLIKKRYSDYSKIENTKGITGVEVAQEILKKHGMDNVYVVETTGYLSDHFDPTSNVVRLSSDVFHGDTIAAASVAAHEVGHAIQYKEGYWLMKLRSAIVPAVNFSSKFGYLAILIGAVAQLTTLIYLGIIMLFAILFFQLVTLPVEFDASKRGLENLNTYHILNDSEKDGARKVLFAAALTYVAGLITTLIEIFRIIISVTGDRK